MFIQGLSFIQQVPRKCFDLWQYANIKALFFWKNREDTPFNIKWPKDSVYALGIHLSNSQKVSDKLNFYEKLDVLEKTLNNWKRQKLTLLGKINIVKSVGLSKLIYNASYCQSLKTSVIR